MWILKHVDNTEQDQGLVAVDILYLIARLQCEYEKVSHNTCTASQYTI